MQGIERRCICGTVLASDNAGPLCSPCERAGARVRVTGDQRPLAVRLCRRLAEVYAGSRDSETRTSYLAELTPLLNGLCELFGIERRDSGDSTSRWGAESVVNATNAVVYTYPELVCISVEAVLDERFIAVVADAWAVPLPGGSVRRCVSLSTVFSNSLESHRGSNGYLPQSALSGTTA